MFQALTIKNVDQTIDEIAHTYRAMTGKDIQPSPKLPELPPERDAVGFVGERLDQLRRWMGSATSWQMGMQTGPWMGTTMPAWIPPVDVLESETEVVVLVDLPGIHENDVSLSVMDRVLTVRAERHPDRPAVDLQPRALERPIGITLRSVPLPVGVKTDKADARLHEGVLSVRMERDVPIFKVKKVELK